MAKKTRYRAKTALYNEAGEVLAGVDEEITDLSPTVAALLLEQGIIEEMK